MKTGRKYLVYHIAHIHTAESLGKLQGKVENLLPKVGGILIETASSTDTEMLMGKEQREMKEKIFNDFSYGNLDPSIYSQTFLPLGYDPELVNYQQVIVNLIHGSEKRINIEEEPSSLAQDLNTEGHARRKEWVELFREKRYGEATEVCRRMEESFRKSSEIRDRIIGAQIDKIVKRDKGNMMLFLGVNHSPRSRRSRVVRIGYSWQDYEYLNRTFLERLKNEPNKAAEILLKRIGAEILRDYWKRKQFDSYKALEKASQCLAPLSIDQLKNLYDFIVEYSQEPFPPNRGIIWLKENGYFFEEI